MGMMDDGSIRRVLHAVAPIQNRNYVVMEVKAGLVKEDRKTLLQKWATSGFKRTAQVMMGQPPAPLVKKWQEAALQQKQQQADAEFKKKKADEKTKKALAKKKKELEKNKKVAEKAAKKRAEEAKKKLTESIKKREAEAKGEEYVAPEEEPVEEEPEEEEVEEPEEDVDMDEEPPKVELSAEEKKNYFRKPLIPDISSYQMGISFGKFSVPEKEEGFEEVKFEWSKEKE